jgi:hypothetical protein
MHHIRSRYRNCRQDIVEQVTALQHDPAFRKKCLDYYQKGYKDWVILAAIFNVMLNLKAQDLRLELHRKKDHKKFLELKDMIRNTVYPTSLFHKENMDMQIKLHAVYVLSTYGFELRRSDIKPEVIENFLRERMKHFDYDLPHKPLFGEPPGEWPEI